MQSASSSSRSTRSDTSRTSPSERSARSRPTPTDLLAMRGMPERIQIKTPEQIGRMRVAGLVVARALREMRAAVAPGVTTGDLDAIARDVLADAGATPSFLGYHGFPAVICTSRNDRVVHGIPSAD